MKSFPSGHAQLSTHCAVFVIVSEFEMFKKSIELVNNLLSSFIYNIGLEPPFQYYGNISYK